MDVFVQKEIVLNDISAQIAEYKWDHEQDLRQGDTYHISQKASGARVHVQNFEASVFDRAGAVGFLPPYHETRVAPLSEQITFLTIRYSSSYFERAAEIDPGKYQDVILFAVPDSRLESIMLQINSEMLNPRLGSDIFIESAANMALVNVARHLHSAYDRKASRAAKGGLAPWQLKRLLDRIEASGDLGYPDLTELAQVCRVSQSHLMRSFRRSMGMPLYKYISDRRFAAAKKLLNETDLSLKEIAAQLGLCGPAYFVTAFHRTCGVTPNEFRKLTRSRVPTTDGPSTANT